MSNTGGMPPIGGEAQIPPPPPGGQPRTAPPGGPPPADARTNPYLSQAPTHAGVPGAWRYPPGAMPQTGGPIPFSPRPVSRDWVTMAVVVGLGVFAVMAVIFMVAVAALAPLVGDVATTVEGSATSSPSARATDYSVPGAGPLQPGDTNAASICGLGQVALSGTVNTAPPTSWAPVHGMAAPTVEGQGPGERAVSGYRSCFARTPTGALLAAANAFVTDGAGVEARRDLCTDGMVKSPGQALALLKSYKRPDSDGTVQIVGFVVEKYDGYVSDIELALQADDGWTGAVDATMMWSDGDWKLVVDSDGGYFYEAEHTRNIDDFVRWSDSGPSTRPTQTPSTGGPVEQA